MLDLTGPMSKEADMVHAEKYRGKNENFREAMNRISATLQDDHEHYMSFRKILLSMSFMPPGRVQAGAGALKNVTLYNCFVMPTIHDSFTDGPTEEEIAALPFGTHPPLSIMDTAKASAITMRQGGGVGYDISTLRPSGDVIHGVQGITDGPLAFAGIYDATGRATSSAGNRRGAQMLVMRVDHPDIEQFIRAKQVYDDSVPWDMRPLRNFNMSVAITDEFMQAVIDDQPFKLRFNGKTYREVNAVDLWEMIMRANYDWAEPGVLFIDTINRMNNLYYCETIAATNPCGEQPLPPYGACLLGSFNAVKFLIRGEDGKFCIDYDKLDIEIPTVVRAMDNVIDRARYPLPQQKEEALNKRRMGLGITGLANAIEAMGYPYGTPEFLKEQDKLMSFLNNKCYQASALLASEKGSFPLYDAEKYLAGETIQGLWPSTIAMIKLYGIRNSHLTSIAPTGTISFCADNISSGAEPVLAYKQSRKVIMTSGDVVVEVGDYGSIHLGTNGRTVAAGDISAEEHIAVLTTAQRNVDSAVSKTVNVPTNTSYDDFKNLYMMAWKQGAKGCTTYRPNDKYDEPIKSMDEPAVEIEDDTVCGYDPETGMRTGACAND